MFIKFTATAAVSKGFAAVSKGFIAAKCYLKRNNFSKISATAAVSKGFIAAKRSSHYHLILLLSLLNQSKKTFSAEDPLKLNGM